MTTESRWPDDRAAELNLLRDLLATVSGLNNGSGFLDAVCRCIIMADRLRLDTMDGSRPSFIRHLRRDCIKERTATETTTQADDITLADCLAEINHALGHWYPLEHDASEDERHARHVRLFQFRDRLAKQLKPNAAREPRGGAA